ncbi:MAG: signal peptidase II [Candidatus Velamenicoccus archaeovorus]
MPILQVILIAVGVVALDRLTKSAAETYLCAIDTHPVIPQVFHLTLVHNTGAAFGLWKGGAVFLILTTVFCMAMIVAMLKSKRLLNKVFGLSAIDGWLCLSFGLILGGAVGNLIDRLRYSYVIDFLDFRIWPVFNVADSAITVGGAVLFLKIFLHEKGKWHGSSHL